MINNRDSLCCAPFLVRLVLQDRTPFHSVRYRSIIKTKAGWSQIPIFLAEENRKFSFFRKPVHLTNRQCFSVVYTLIDNDIRHHSGQNLLLTHSVAPR